MLQANSLCMQSVICTFRLNSLACSRRSDSRARGSVESESNCTPGKRGGTREGERESPSPFAPLVSPRFFFFLNFSPALYYMNAWNRLWIRSLELELRVKRQLSVSYHSRKKKNNLPAYFYG